MDNEKERQLKAYSAQIVATFFLILAILIALTVIKDLYLQTKYEIKSKRLTSSIYRRSKLSAFILLFVTLYFTYNAYQAYQKDKTNANLSFLIAAELGLIAVFIRYITLRANDVENVEDII